MKIGKIPESERRRSPRGGEEDSTGHLSSPKRTVEKPSAIFQTVSEGKFSEVRHLKSGPSDACTECHDLLRFPLVENSTLPLGWGRG
jgi:hypothetical protein